MAILNWLPNAGFNKETRFFTTQDIAEGAEKIQTADKAIRDIKRKRAIEKATAEAIDAKGELNQEALRQSLKNAGFGEDAEATINKITSERNAKLDENIKLRKSLGEMVALNLIDNDKANMILEGVMKQSQAQTPPDSKAVAGSPGAATSTTPTTSTTPSVGVPATISQQFSPDYVKLGPADFGKYAGSTPTIEPVKIEFSSDPTLRKKQIRAAEQTLSIKIPSNITDADLNVLVNKRADELSVSQNQLKPPAAFAGDLAKIRSHETEVASARAKTKADIMSALSGQINTGIQLATGQQNAETSRGQLEVKKAEVVADRMAPWSNATLDQKNKNGEPLLSQGIKDKVQVRSPQAKGAQHVMETIDKMFAKGGLGVNDPNYRSSLFTLAKYVMRLKGLEASDQKMASVEENLKNGVNIDNIIDSFEGPAQDVIRKIIKEGYRGATTDINTIRTTVRLAQQEFRDLVSGSSPAYNDEYFDTFPLYGESNVEKQRWIDSKNKPKTARESLERKKKEGKKTSSTEGF